MGYHGLNRHFHVSKFLASTALIGTRGFYPAMKFYVWASFPRLVYIRVFTAKTAANARRYLRNLERACPIRIRLILTDNGKEITDRLFGLLKRATTEEHEPSR